MSKMASKIQALLAKAESTDFAEEAEALTEKAMKLMAKHAVSEAMLEDARTDRDPREKVETRHVTVPNPYASDRMIILQQVAEASGCRMYYNKQRRDGTKTRNNIRIHYVDAFVVGFPSDIDRVEGLSESLYKQEAKDRKVAADAMEFYSIGDKKTYSSNFIRSFAYRIGARLKESYKAEVETHEGSVALVLQSRQDAVDAEYNSKGLGTSRTSKQANRAGSMAGYAAGNRASLGREIKG